MARWPWLAAAAVAGALIIGGAAFALRPAEKPATAEQTAFATEIVEYCTFMVRELRRTSPDTYELIVFEPEVAAERFVDLYSEGNPVPAGADLGAAEKSCRLAITRG